LVYPETVTVQGPSSVLNWLLLSTTNSFIHSLQTFI